jgi:6-hydroxynicotinate 3-monooxygenase
MRLRKDTSIAIIGAGIGGLAVAAALRQAGFAATVYEQADAFARVGAGIQQSPNAMKVHRGLGIEGRLRDVGFAPTSSLNRDALSGKITNDHPLGRAVEERYGAPYLTLHRGDLHAALADIVPAQAVIRGKKLIAIAEDGARVSLAFADGTKAEADLVIGADGAHSLVREHVAGPEQPRFTGRLAYRTTFPASRLHGVDIGTARTKWWGKDRHIVIYYVTAKRDEVYFTTSQPEKAEWMTRESWSTKGDLAELRAAFAHFHSDIQAVLAAAPEVHKWGIYERNPLPAWSKGRVTLLGDACHPMTPYMASAPPWRSKTRWCCRAASPTKTSTASKRRCAPTKRSASRAPARCRRAPAPTPGCARRPIPIGSTATMPGACRCARRPPRSSPPTGKPDPTCPLPN